MSSQPLVTFPYLTISFKEFSASSDETANPTYVAADLLSQAEHDELASAILVTTSEELADKVASEIERFVQILSRKDIIENPDFHKDKAYTSSESEIAEIKNEGIVRVDIQYALYTPYSIIL